MIRVELGREVSPGMFEYRIPFLQFEGRSHQPLLDACRAIKRMGGDPAEIAGLFRSGRSTADMSVKVEVGAGLTVSERSKGTIRFEKYREFTGIDREVAE